MQQDLIVPNPEKLNGIQPGIRDFKGLTTIALVKIDFEINEIEGIKYLTMRLDSLDNMNLSMTIAPNTDYSRALALMLHLIETLAHSKPFKVKKILYLTYRTNSIDYKELTKIVSDKILQYQKKGSDNAHKYLDQ